MSRNQSVADAMNWTPSGPTETSVGEPAAVWSLQEFPQFHPTSVTTARSYASYRRTSLATVVGQTSYLSEEEREANANS